MAQFLGRTVVHLGGGDAHLAAGVEVHVDVLRQDRRRSRIMYRHGGSAGADVAVAVIGGEGDGICTEVGAGE